MANWEAFASAAPEIAALGRERLYQSGPGLAYLGTVRADGAPRIHPVCANIVDGGLYLMILPSPKRADLVRDGRFALHAFPMEGGDDEFYLTGTVSRREDAALVERVARHQRASGATTGGAEWLFELDLERALYARYTPAEAGGGFPPDYLEWSEG